MAEKQSNKKTNWLIVAITVAAAVLGGLFSMNSSEFYDTLVRPPLAPPSIVFPIVWGILYVLMAIAMILYFREKPDDSKTFWLYALNLVLNAMWPLFFFALRQVDVALVILLAMIFVNLFVMGRLKDVTWAFYLYLPYLVWQLFALYLNFAITLLN